MKRKRIDYCIDRMACVEGRPAEPPNEQLLTWARVLDELRDDLANAKANGLDDAKYSRLARRAKKLQEAIRDFAASQGLDASEYLSS